MSSMSRDRVKHLLTLPGYYVIRGIIGRIKHMFLEPEASDVGTLCRATLSRRCAGRALACRAINNEQFHA